MSFGRLFFSFRGRINRSMFWVGVLAIIGAGFSGYHIFRFIFDRVTAQYPIDEAITVQVQETVPLVATAVALIAIWTLLVKRLHDRGKSAWLFLLFAVLAGISASWAGFYPLDWLPRPAIPELGLRAIGIIGGIGLVWLLVEVLIIPSRPGANRYGADPLMTEC